MDFWSLALAIVLGLGLGLIMMRNQGVDFSKISVLKRNDFLDNMRKGQLIDVRKKAQYEEDKIKGARNFTTRQLTAKISKLRKDQTVYLYCQNGRRSKRVARSLMRKKYHQVYVLEGGFDSYNNPK
ncbi:putative adenylyltransferase/sulfurtransferase MoeZ [Candidatus Izimaplasma bacterium HR1]|jgi:rhodanese-related sulfurtransferase|uniref:rhodanese-like domain-containing protein n=1 Tax=Candidatus Izimoplasma sp. HR1 TaxID=1541959 RepID=UPI0004F8D0DE|nr:putative adenylyltransferase/sulfurtransferase MoeZ [Candidatus Izimaplasma bacterium HR1]